MNNILLYWTLKIDYPYIIDIKYYINIFSSTFSVIGKYFFVLFDIILKYSYMLINTRAENSKSINMFKYTVKFKKY